MEPNRDENLCVVRQSDHHLFNVVGDPGAVEVCASGNPTRLHLSDLFQ